MKLKFKKELQVGLMALVAFVLLYKGVEFLRGSDFFARSDHYYAIFKNVNGLSISTPVTISGYPIGRVDEIELLQSDSNKVKVIFMVNKKIRLNKNSRIILGDKDLLGEKVMKLDVGLGNEQLEPMSEVTGVLEEGFAGQITNQIVPVKESVTALLTNLNQLVDTLKSSEKSLKNSFENLEKLSSGFNSSLNENRPSIRNTTKNVELLTANLNANLKNVSALISNLNQFSTTLNSLDLASTKNKLDSSARSLKGLMAGLERGEGSMGKLMKDDSLYKKSNDAVKALESLLQDMEANPQRYVHFSLIGRKDKKKKE